MISRKRKYRNIAISTHRTYKKKNPTKKRPCKNCGRLFIKQHNRQVYCKGCQPIVQKQQHNEAQRRYHEKWRSTIKRRKLLRPGTTELPLHPAKDWDKEAENIKKELNRIKNPYKKMYDYNILGF